MTIAIADHGTSLDRYEPSLAGPSIRTGNARYEDGEWHCWRLAGTYVTGDRVEKTLATKDDAIVWLKAVKPQ